MNQISESLFKIAALFLITKGLMMLGGVLAILADSETSVQLPLWQYLSNGIPVLMGFLVWFFSPQLAVRAVENPEHAFSNLVPIGAFLMGLYFVSSNLPLLLSAYLHYRESLRIGVINPGFNYEVMAGIIIFAALVAVGGFLMLFSKTIGRVFCDLK